MLNAVTLGTENLSHRMARCSLGNGLRLVTSRGTPGRDSNRHCNGFKPFASAIGLQGLVVSSCGMTADDVIQELFDRMQDALHAELFANQRESFERLNRQLDKACNDASQRLETDFECRPTRN